MSSKRRRDKNGSLKYGNISYSFERFGVTRPRVRKGVRTMSDSVTYYESSLSELVEDDEAGRLEQISRLDPHLGLF